MGKPLLGLQGKWGPRTPSAHYLTTAQASSPARLTQLGVAARTPQHHPAAPALDLPGSNHYSVLPRPRSSPWCRPTTPWSTAHLWGGGGSAIISSDACWPCPTQGIPILGPTMAPLKPRQHPESFPAPLSASLLHLLLYREITRDTCHGYSTKWEPSFPALSPPACKQQRLVLHGTDLLCTPSSP